jgi:hypothetical protein
MPIPLGILAATASGGIPTFEHIATTTLASTATTITISSLPQNFKHLHIRTFSKVTSTTNSGNLYLRVNGDATSGRYFWSQNVGSTSSWQYNSDNTNETDMRFGVALSSATANLNAFSTHLIDISNYSATNKFTNIMSKGGYSVVSAASQINLASGGYNQTGAVTSLTIGTNETFAIGTTIAVYGLVG